VSDSERSRRISLGVEHDCDPLTVETPGRPHSVADKLEFRQRRQPCEQAATTRAYFGRDASCQGSLCWLYVTDRAAASN